MTSNQIQITKDIDKAYDFLFEDEQDWPLFFFEQYLQSLLLTPFIVIETLQACQYQKRKQDYTDSVAEPDLYLPKLHSMGDTARLVMKFENQGWTGLFRAHTTQFMYSSFFNALQPIFEESMNNYWNVLDDVDPLTLSLSHCVAGVIASPLELVRARLIVQPNSERKTVYGPFHCLYSVCRENENQGMMRAFYFNQNLIPTILSYSITPLLKYAAVYYIEHELGLDQVFSPVLYKLAQLAFLGVETLLMCPLELARKRLFIQRFDSFKPGVQATVSSRVRTRVDPYGGVLSICYNAIKDEGSGDENKISNISNDDWRSIYGDLEEKNSTVMDFFRGVKRGVFSLYRTFWPRYITNSAIFLINEIKNDDRF